MPFPPVNKVNLADLELVEIDMNDLRGHKVTINKSDFFQADRRGVKISEQKNELNLSIAEKGIQTNVWLTVVDRDGVEHLGTLFVAQE